MKRTITGGLATIAAVAFLGAGVASAQDVPDDCYPIPPEGCPVDVEPGGEVRPGGEVATPPAEGVGGAGAAVPLEVKSAVQTRPTGGVLARTGVSVTLLVGAAAGALALGFGMVRSRRRSAT